jgi:predicted acylesterase/phospholipase RssA
MRGFRIRDGKCAVSGDCCSVHCDWFGGPFSRWQGVGLTSTDHERTREIRVALVLYGGVSLAVYENGVTRCFYDLVHENGVFDILLRLLDAKAKVDVVSGTSAGGINGLFLAAALESGADFAPLADLWRQLGDLGALLPDPQHANEAEALLDGEYFHCELVKAFQTLCTVDDSCQHHHDSEMDVFITGTDLDGHARRYRDSLGNEIADKEHRVVFHLQHRPERKSLGVSKAKAQVDVNLQANILGAIARITASFPLGFPPVRGSELKPDVRKALGEIARQQTTTSGSFADGRFFVDGGVLDNKPFGPALRAIFYRMPGGVVDRRLFYVEPDPKPFVDPPTLSRPASTEHRMSPQRYPKPTHRPLAVGLASLTSIPGHEGIADDLESLLAHNQRVHWLLTLKKTLCKSAQLMQALASPPPLAYVQARIDCVVRSLVSNGDAVPSVRDYPQDKTREQLLDCLTEVLTPLARANLHQNLDRYDIVFHLRRTFHLLYEFYDEFAQRPDQTDARTVMRLLGRVIKVLKLILDMMVNLRDALVPTVSGRPITKADAEAIFSQFRQFLASDEPHWAPLIRHLETVPADRQALATHRDREGDFFKSDHLSQVAALLREVKVGNASGNPASLTILDRLANATATLVKAYHGTADRFDRFTALDYELYPLQFTGDIYELDEIEFVRISPADAQIGLSKGDARDKVTGDELAHFSAFLRRDWRTNDILQGRFDGICQIVCSLLDTPALQRVLTRADQLPDLFQPAELARILPLCPAGHREMLYQRWEALVQAWKAPPGPGQWTRAVECAAQQFREQLIRAGQEQAFFEDVEKVFTDLHYQEIKFGRRLGPRGASSGTSEGLLESEARQAANRDQLNPTQTRHQEDATEAALVNAACKAAKEDLALVPPSQQWLMFRAMKFGRQQIVGPKGYVPNQVIGEYVSLAYLMFWGMLRQSLGDRSTAFLDRSRVQWVGRTPVLFLYHLLALLRRERLTAVTVIVLTTGVLLGLGVTALFLQSWGLVWIAVVGLGIIMVWVTWGPDEPLSLGAILEPYVWMSKRARKTTLLVSSLGSALMMLLVGWASPPGGYIRLEWAVVTGTHQEIIKDWAEVARGLALLGLGLDYVFLLFYPLALSLLCGIAARGVHRWSLLKRWGPIMASLVLLAAPLNAVENYGLLQLMSRQEGHVSWHLLTRLCIIARFALLGASAVYLLVALWSLLRAKFNRRQPSHEPGSAHQAGEPSGTLRDRLTAEQPSAT